VPVVAIDHRDTSLGFVCAAFLSSDLSVSLLVGSLLRALKTVRTGQNAVCLPFVIITPAKNCRRRGGTLGFGRFGGQCRHHALALHAVQNAPKRRLRIALFRILGWRGPQPPASASPHRLTLATASSCASPTKKSPADEGRGSLRVWAARLGPDYPSHSDVWPNERKPRAVWIGGAKFHGTFRLKAITLSQMMRSFDARRERGQHRRPHPRSVTADSGRSRPDVGAPSRT
jgi:hypothetical protein